MRRTLVLAQEPTALPIYGRCVVAAVSGASDRHVDSGFGEPIGVSNESRIDGRDHILIIGPGAHSKGWTQIMPDGGLNVARVKTTC